MINQQHLNPGTHANINAPSPSSPLPWRIRETWIYKPFFGAPTIEACIEDADGKRIAEMLLADAELIIRSVNKTPLQAGLAAVAGMPPDDGGRAA